MDIDLHIKIKPLVANLLRIHIGQYLQTSDFNHLTLEHGFDKIWIAAKKQVRNNSNVVFIGFDNSGDYEDAYQLLLNLFYKDRSDIKEFFFFIKITIIDFVRWTKGKTRIDNIIANLKSLDMPETDLTELEKVANQINETPQPSYVENSMTLTDTTVEVDENLCFVIMPFTEKLDPIYSSVIKPVLKDLKITALRADEVFTSKPIIEDIWQNIKKARFLIADLTDRNPNVFYELGLAHALNKDTLLLTQSLSDIPFDLKHFRIIVYQDSISGSDKLKNTLKEFIKELIRTSK